MKKTILLTAAFFLAEILYAQSYTDPATYMNDISKELDLVQTNLWDYTNAASHQKMARRVEKKRLEIMEVVKDSKQKIWLMPGYKGDRSLHDSAYSYLKIVYTVLNENYSKLADMEDLADQSYDAMKTYILAKQNAYNKLDTAVKMLNREFKLFAAKNNVLLNESKTKTAEKLDEAGRVYDYYNEVYLLFFKSYKQETFIMEQLNKSGLSSLKQYTGALGKFSSEDLQNTNTLQAFEGDATLKTVCGNFLQFYKDEALTKIPLLYDNFIRKDTLEKIKKDLSSKPRTQQDIVTYNTAVTDFNSSLATYNTTIKKINDNRGKLLTKWNDVVGTFIDKHVPKN